MELITLNVLRTMPDAKPAFGVACVDDQVFVLRRRSPTVEIHDVTSFTLTGRLTVEGLRNPLDMAACQQSKQLFIVDGLEPSGKVYRTGINQKAQPIINWSVGDVSMNISVGPSGSVLVTCGTSKEIREFRSDGELIRRIPLPDDLVSPQHAVLLPTGQLVVCHGWMDDRFHRVCVFDNADVIGAVPEIVFGDCRGSASRLFHNPSHVAVDSCGRVYVADMGNRRVAVWDPYSGGGGSGLVAEGRVGDKKRLPSRLWLDEPRGRLYVAYNEWKEVFWTCGGVTVFDVKAVVGSGRVAQATTTDINCNISKLKISASNGEPEAAAAVDGYGEYDAEETREDELVEEEREEGVDDDVEYSVDTPL